MKAHYSLRFAAFCYAFLTLGHSAGMAAPSSGPEEDRVVAAMKSWTFDAMGTPRTVFDFFRGEGFYLSVFALLMTVLCWQVGNLGRRDPASARSLILSLLGASLASTALCYQWFFAAPLVSSLLGSLGLGLGWFLLGRAEAR